MANKGAIAASATASEIVAANNHRGEVVLQYVSGDPCFLSFGEDTPVVDEGLTLSTSHKAIVINDHRATLAVNAICDTAQTTVGTWSSDHS